MMLARATAHATGRKVQRWFEAGYRTHLHRAKLDGAKLDRVKLDRAKLDRSNFITMALSHAYAFVLGCVVYQLVQSPSTFRTMKRLADAKVECMGLMEDMMQQRDARSREALECTRKLQQLQGARKA
jgi:hypothetical protein